MGDNHIISTIYPTDTDLEILRLRRSSCQREFVCYFSTWECVYSLLISSLGFICLCSGYVYLDICKKKKWWKGKKNKHMCVCAQYSPLLGMYIDVWGSFLSSMFVIGSSYVSSLRSHVICIASSYLFVREMSDLLLRTPSHCPSHHYIHYWCDFTSCLIWVDHYLSSHIHCFAVVFIVACNSSHSLRILFSLYSDPSRVRYFASSLHISLPVHFASSVSLSISCSR